MELIFSSSWLIRFQLAFWVRNFNLLWVAC